MATLLVMLVDTEDGRHMVLHREIAGRSGSLGVTGCATTRAA